MLDVLDPKKDAAALEPVLDNALTEVTSDLVTRIAPALSAAIKEALDGFTMTITVSIHKVGAA